MQINRDNYETYFLLYADAALQPDEYNMVNNFVAENTDLKNELQLLQAAVLPAEEIKFTDKSFLYRDTIFGNQLQEKLLLKIDNELSEGENYDLDIVLEKNKFATTAYHQLLQTKLSKSEPIIFADKHLLYKKQPAKIILFSWKAIAAAVVLIGFGLFVGIQMYTKSTGLPMGRFANRISPVVIKNNKIKINPKSDVESYKSSNEIAIASISNNKIEKKEIVKNEVEKNTVLINNDFAKENNVVQNKTNNTNDINQFLLKEKNVPKQSLIIPETSNATTILAAAPKSTLNTNINTVEGTITLDKMYTQTMALTSEDKSENKIFYLDEDEVKKSKVGGFFKKIKRIVERTANIKTGNTLQIAGFEIAAK